MWWWNAGRSSIFPLTSEMALKLVVYLKAQTPARIWAFKYATSFNVPMPSLTSTGILNSSNISSSRIFIPLYFNLFISLNYTIEVLLIGMMRTSLWIVRNIWDAKYLIGGAVIPVREELRSNHNIAVTSCCHNRQCHKNVYQTTFYIVEKKSHVSEHERRRWSNIAEIRKLLIKTTDKLNLCKNDMIWYDNMTEISNVIIVLLQ